MKNYLKRTTTFFLAILMLVSVPLQAFAEVKVDHKDIAGDKAKFVNRLKPVKIARPEAGKKTAELIKNPELPAVYTLRRDYKAEKGEKYEIAYQPYIASVGEAASDDEKAKINKVINLPDLPGYEKPQENFTNSYDAIKTAAEKGHKTSDNGDKYLALKEFQYAAVKNNVIVKHVFQDINDFNKYTNQDGTITRNDGKTGTFTDKDGAEKKYDLSKDDEKKAYNKLVEHHEVLRTLKGNTGSTLEVQPLEEKERPGYVPQIDKLKTQVPEDTSDFRIEYRYNRAHYDVIFDTQGGTPLQSRTYYFDQEIPKIDEQSIPRKKGSEFLGWKPSHDLVGEDGTKYKEGEIIKDASGKAIVDLGNIYYQKNAENQFIKDNEGEYKKGKLSEDIKLKMPALKLGDGKTVPREKLTFTAVWKDKEKSSYAVQFWVEKADHDENASRLEKYDFIAARVYKDVDTGFRPDLNTESPGPVELEYNVNGVKKKETLPGLPFPDLDQARLEKIWNGAKFNRDEHLLLNKFYVYNKDLTKEQNKDPKQPSLVKDVNSNDETVYNIYYDRQVYHLYFTDSNYFKTQSSEWGIGGQTFFPEIYEYDKNGGPEGKGGAKLVGGPGNPYNFKARFNEHMKKWPNDAMQTKGFTPGLQSYGWGPNYAAPEWPTHLDTPPYRLNADEFLDMDYGNVSYESRGGYAKKINKGDGTNIDVDIKDFATLSFGIKQGKNSIPHHMDLWMDGFKDGETIIRYDLYRSKADTDDPEYPHKAPKVQGFKAKYDTEKTKLVDEDDINDINDKRDEVTTIPNKEYWDILGFKHKVGLINFILAFFNNADNYGDAKDGNPFAENGYLRFKYTRDKFPLRFNYDPSKIKGDDEFSYPTKGGTVDQNKSANALETFYEFPLKVLSPDLFPALTKEDIKAGKKQEYFKDNPKNFLDDANNLYKLGLYDLLQRDKKNPSEFYKDKDNNYKVKRPENLSDQMIFKGWALDPAGTKLIRDIDGEKMPNHALNLYAKWGEPDYKWKVTIDPNGGNLDQINADNLTRDKRIIDEGDVDKSKKETYPKKEDNDGNKKVFTVIQRQKLKDLPKPTRLGYDFLGWEVIRYKKDQKGDFTNEQDTTYREKYKVPELYSFGTDVVAPIYLKAIWVENKRVDIKVEHYYLTSDLKLDTSMYPNPETNTLRYKRVGDYVPTIAEKQDQKWILANHEELKDKLNGTFTGKDGKEHDLKADYLEYNGRVKLNNTFFQTFKALDNINKGTEENPVYEPNPDNVFKFYYRPFRTRDYKVNYIDDRGKAEVEKFFEGLGLRNADAETSSLTDKEEKDAKILEINTENKAKYDAKKGELEEILKKYRIIDPEKVSNGNRHYDARNYRPIPGWALVDNPQQQLFFNVNEETNDFLGINGTGADEIFFYYKDVRTVEVNDPKDPVPAGYVRVAFKIDSDHKGGVFKDKDGNDKTELYYDVIKGLKSDNLPHPVIWEEGKKDSEGKALEKEVNRYYITPDQGKSFKGWDNEKWLNKETEINRDYSFTAYFDWSGLSVKSEGLVRTEAYKDPNGKWTNDFAPTLKDLKEQLVWKEKNEVKPIPEGTEIKFFDADGKELTKDEQIYELVTEKKAADKDELVRTINIKAKVTFKDGKQTQELDIPITIYKNRYEALNEKGHKPLFLSEAEKKDAKDGGLKDVTGNYVKVTIKPNKDFDNKDNKVYYVNPKAWVDIPEIDAKGDSNFTNWTADKKEQNEESKENGIFDFKKRHKFTEDTVITPVGAGDVVEQKEGEDKPDVPKTYVKVIVKTTDKATNETAFEKTFWVNPTKEVKITVANPKGKENQEVDIPNLGKKKVNYVFNEWQKVKTGEADDSSTDVKPVEKIDLTKNQYTDKVTIIEAAYKKSIQSEKIDDPLKTNKLDVPQGKKIEDKDLIEKITPQNGKEIDSITVIENPDTSEPGLKKAKVIVKYKDGTTQGTNDNPVVIPVEVHKNIIPETPDGKKPSDALENYVKVIFTAGEGGKLDKTLTGNFVYYVSPEVEVDLNATANDIGKIPATGYIANGGKWENKDKKELKGTFKDKETVFKYNFFKSKDIVEKTDQNPDKPEGYVTVKFIAGENGEVVGGNKTYFVNPDANIKLVDKDKATQGATNELVVPEAKASDNYGFTGWVEKIDYTNPIKGDREHVAKFTLGQVTLTYEAGEGAKGTAPTAVTVDHGTIIRLANADGLSKDNATFAGWKLDGDDTIYQPGAQIKLEKARTATAQWNAAKHNVKFILSDGVQFAQEEVEHGKTATEPTKKPTLAGKVFMGWKENASDENYFDFANTAITADKTLIAIWQDPVQNIKDGDKVEDQFIKVTFKQGDHGTLRVGQENKASISYKVAKELKFLEAFQKGKTLPEIIADKYFKAMEENGGWDKERELNGQDIEFTAQYQPIADVIPVDPEVTDEEQIQKEKPEGMVLVTFTVPEDKAYMLGNTKFYVKKNEVVNIETPLVRRLELGNGVLNDYVFKGWDLTQINNEWKFNADTTIGDGAKVKPTITIRIPSAGDPEVSVDNMTSGATAYIEVTRSNKTTKIEAEYDTDYDMYFFEIPNELGGKLKKRDRIEVYAELNGIRSDTREYRVK